MTAQEMAANMLQFPHIVEEEFRKTIQGVATAAVARSKQLMTEQIYAIPEDLSASGKKRQARLKSQGRRFVAVGKDKKWRRTGHLRRSEKFEIRSPYEVAIVNTAAYAEPRHEAGKPGRRSINPLRESHWQDQMAEEFASTLLDLTEVTMRKILERIAR